MKVATLQLDEILQKVNDSNDVRMDLALAIATPYVRPYLFTFLSETWPTFDVDDIEWKKYDYHRSLAGANLLSRPSYNIFNSVLMNPDSNKHTKEFQCKALLEMLYIGEANVLIAILKKDLQSLYPNITHEILNNTL
jgi:hypothetical protein